MTVEELGQRMSGEELVQWQVYLEWKAEKQKDAERDRTMFSTLDAKAAKAAKG